MRPADWVKPQYNCLKNTRCVYARVWPLLLTSANTGRDVSNIKGISSGYDLVFGVCVGRFEADKPDSITKLGCRADLINERAARAKRTH